MENKTNTPIYKTLRENLLQLQKKEGAVTLNDFLKILGRRSGLILIFIFSVPFCLPIHLPGFSTPFGLLIGLISLQLVFRETFWIPKFLREKKIKRKTLKKLVDTGLKIIEKLGKIIHPRWFWMTAKGMRNIHFFYILILGVFLALPLPIPTTNIGVAWPLLFITSGLLERDGIFIFVSYLTGITYLIVISFITYGALLAL